jgi:hypothetical protein
VFFSSPVHKELVAQIKKDSSVLPRIAALSEVMWLSCFAWVPQIIMSAIHYILFFIFQMNLEYFAIDSQVSIILQKDHWFRIWVLILLCILEIHILLWRWLILNHITWISCNGGCTLALRSISCHTR